ncbi:MAG: putative Ig domain-containing protein, partial [Myxococcota bacterium]
MRIDTSLSIALAMLATSVVGCGEPVFQSLVDFRDATEDQCEFGGQLVVTGFDSNENGALDDDEIDASQAVCNGDPGVDGEQGIPGTNALLLTTDEAPGDNCADGGVRIDVGLDDNGNGELEVEEITATSFVCDGAQGIPGLNSIVSTLPDAPSCGDVGGITVQTGVDDNGDGILDPSEVDSTETICNGEDGVNSLLEIVAEPPGANCLAGGQQLTSGLDQDRNGVLEGAEIDDTVFVCDPVANLVEVTPEAASQNCPDGGSRIDAGLDLDGNGVLDAGEIDTTTFVCNGDDGLPSLVLVTAEAAGANCAVGGTKVESGLDVDEDGVLSESEVTSTRFVCDGADGIDGIDGTNGTDGIDGIDGAADLVSVSTVPPGPNCAGGGILVESGPDTNGNDVLDPSEVVTSDFLCDGDPGVDGSDGTNGQRSLVDVSAVAPGADCVNGGQRIEVGLDANDDGILDPAEVTSTTFVCNGLASVPFAILQDPALPQAQAGSPYEVTLTGVGGTGGDYSWQVVGGALPAGLSVDPMGTPDSRISGNPTTGGTFTFTVQVTDFFGQAAEKTFTVFVEGPLLQIETFAVRRPIAGQPYTAPLSATGGAPPYTWSVLEGALPNGLSLDSTTGLVSGTLTDGVPTSVQFRVTDSSGEQRDTRIAFNDAPRWTAFSGDVITDAVYELGIASIESGVVSPPTIINPPAVTGGDLGQTTSAASLSDVKFSANGDRMSFTGDFDVDGAEELWWVDTSGPVPGPAIKAHAPFTTGDQDVTAGDHEWSADGRYLAFRADDQVNSEFNLFIVDTFSANPTAVQVNPPLLTNQDVTATFGFSPDGSLLAFEADLTNTDVDDLYIVDVTQPTLFANISNHPAFADLLTFQWAPDSQSLLFVSDRNVDGVNEMFLVPNSGGLPGQAVQVNEPFVIGTAGDLLSGVNDYGFSPDGQRIFYIADSFVDGLNELFVVDADALGVARYLSVAGLGSVSQDVELAEWTPDSQALVFAQDGNVLDVMELWLGDATGTLPGFPIQLNGPMVSGGDIGQSTSPSNNDVVVDPNNRGVFYAADETTASKEDLYFVDFGSPGAPTIVTSNFTASSDLNSFLVSQDGGTVIFNGDPVSAVDELYGVDISSVPFG